MPSDAPLPILFGLEKRLIGWQGLTLTTPANWSPTKFTGSHQKGDMRLDDDEGVRLEIRWESGKKSFDVPKSVDEFLSSLEKDLKKHSNFERIKNAKVVSRSRKKKEQLTNFGWSAVPGPVAGSGFGCAWYCPVCERALFAQVLGRDTERPAAVERLAGEVLTSLECHGEGGWETWSVFDLKVQVPAEFLSTRSQLLLNKLQLEWARPRPSGLGGLGRRNERIVVKRLPIANILLEDTTLRDWAEHGVRFANKQLSLGKATDVRVHGHEGLLYQGPYKDLRARIITRILDLLLQRKTPPGQVLVWHCPQSNRIWSVETELTASNAHVAEEVIASIECH
jgi:hypothetical protein